MNISVDGGALCAPVSNRYGTTIFSENIVRALGEYDPRNAYSVYSFCNYKPHRPVSHVAFQNLLPKTYWMTVRVTLEEYLHKKDIFLALNQALPLFTSARIISFSHGLSFLLVPEQYPDSRYYLQKQLESLFLKSERVVVSSQKVKDEIAEHYPQFEKKVVAIPFGIPFDFFETKKQPREKYFLFVGMNTPVKNIDFMVKCFKTFIEDEKYYSYKLYIVGSSYQSGEKNIVNIPVVTRDTLREYYQKAAGYLTTSFYESFNLPVLEALSQGCPVLGLSTSLIPELASYCTVVENRDEFISGMKQLVKDSGDMIALDQLRKKFSWEHYVNTLVSLY